MTLTYFPTLLYLGLAVLGLITMAQVWRVRLQLPNKQVYIGVMLLHATVIGETVFYGVARLSVEIYASMSWTWPLVAAHKVSYAVAFYLLILGYRRVKT